MRVMGRIAQKWFSTCCIGDRRLALAFIIAEASWKNNSARGIWLTMGIVCCFMLVRMDNHSFLSFSPLFCFTEFSVLIFFHRVEGARGGQAAGVPACLTVRKMPPVSLISVRDR